MSNQKPIAVLGSGSWGTALALLLADNSQSVHLWGLEAKAILASGSNEAYLPGIRFPANLKVFVQLQEAIRGVEDYLIAVPSEAFEGLLSELRPLLTGRERIAWATKGLHKDFPYVLSALISKTIHFSPPMAVLSGPTFAQEVAHKMPSAVTIACNDPTFQVSLRTRFENDYFRVRPSSDLVGTCLSGAVKNVIAIASGMVDGLGFGANTRYALITAGLAEMQQLGEVMGADAVTFSQPAGVGDLMLTCSDNQSRNRRFGLALGKGGSVEEALQVIGQVVEGMKTCEKVVHLAQHYQIKMPIVEFVYAILYQGRSLQKSDVFRLL